MLSHSSTFTQTHVVVEIFDVVLAITFNSFRGTPWLRTFLPDLYEKVPQNSQTVSFLSTWIINGKVSFFSAIPSRRLWAWIAQI